MFRFWKRKKPVETIPNDAAEQRAVEPAVSDEAAVSDVADALAPVEQVGVEAPEAVEDPVVAEPPADPIPENRSPEHRDLLVHMLGEGAWCVDYLRTENGSIELGGWAVAPGYPSSALEFTLNDRRFDEVGYPLRRDDLEQLVWYVPEGLKCGVICRMHASPEEAFPDGTAVLKFTVKETGAPVREEHNYYYDARTASDPLPPAELRMRVHGTANEFSFRMEGYSNFVKVRLALQRIFGRDYGDFTSILDWGCGCGRFLRYFRDVERSGALTGADVDKESVQWSAANLPFAKCVALPLHPPSPLDNAAYDLLIGISIFTHLGEREQFEWLEELGRIAAPGAVLLMSIHGETAVSRQAWSMHELLVWKANGFTVGASGDLDGVLEEADYYKTTFHTRAYIEQHWTGYFDIVELIPGYIGNLQDLVVMVKRA